MPLSRKQIKDRIDVILNKQSKLEKLVAGMQDKFFEEMLKDFAGLIETPTGYVEFFNRFVKDYHRPVLNKILEDLRYIVEDNKYLIDESGVEDAQKKVKAIEESLLAEFGITASGEIAKSGYLNELILDTSVKRTFRSGLVKYGISKDKLTKRDLKKLEMFIKGDKDTYGIWEYFYAKEDKSGSRVFDVYQKADRLAQVEYSNELGIQAFMYVGGLMDTSRQFCIDRDGKIFLRSEIREWENLSFAGKPKTGYVPEIDLGGYRCRHHLSGIGNATALRLDPTLGQDEKGNLYRKNEG